MQPKRTAYRSPWQNGTAERWIGSARRELLDHVIVFDEPHLRRLLRDYVDYYNADRVHTELRDSPVGRQIERRPSEMPWSSDCRASEDFITATSGEKQRSGGAG